MNPISSFANVRDLVAIPSLQQLEEIRAAAQLLADTVNRGSLMPPGRKFDLRFTEAPLLLRSHPVAALMIHQPNKTGEPAPGEILLNVGYHNLPMLFIHEMAHFYDFACFEPAGSFSSHLKEEFAEWRAVIESTETFKRNQMMLLAMSGRAPGVVIDPKTGEQADVPVQFDLDLDAFLYLEAFARCFCQWIIRKWRKVSTEEIQAVVDYFHKESMNPESVYLSAYWTEAEMEILDDVMSRLLVPQLNRRSAL